MLPLPAGRWRADPRGPGMSGPAAVVVVGAGLTGRAQRSHCASACSTATRPTRTSSTASRSCWGTRPSRSTSTGERCAWALARSCRTRSWSSPPGGSNLRPPVAGMDLDACIGSGQSPRRRATGRAARPAEGRRRPASHRLRDHPPSPPRRRCHRRRHGPLPLWRPAPKTERSASQMRSRERRSRARLCRLLVRPVRQGTCSTSAATTPTATSSCGDLMQLDAPLLAFVLRAGRLAGVLGVHSGKDLRCARRLIGHAVAAAGLADRAADLCQLPRSSLPSDDRPATERHQT